MILPRSADPVAQTMIGYAISIGFRGLRLKKQNWA